MASGVFADRSSKFSRLSGRPEDGFGATVGADFSAEEGGAG